MAETAGGRVVTVAFRVDGGTRIGSGHVRRCLTLAAELRRRGARVVFVSRRHFGHLLQAVERSGFECRALPPADGASLPADDHAAWLGVPQETDAAETITALGATQPDWLVVDHYGIGAAWERVLRQCAARILAIDDLADRTHDCDVLLDQNYFGADTDTRYDGLIPDASIRLLGPRHALLQPEYAAARNRLAPRAALARRVLVFFGGSDPSNETAKALAALSVPSLAHLTVDVVLGVNHPDLDGIRSLIASRPHTTLHVDLPTLAGLMSTAEMAVGAAGATTWERLCLSLPSVVVTVAANQVPFTRALAREGYTCWIGSAPDVTAETYAKALSAGIPGETSDLRPLVDGLGAQRVAEVLTPSPVASLTLRRAIPADAAIFLDWRNEPTARAMSFSSDPVSWTSHRQWFLRKLGDPRCEIHVAVADGLPVGQLRLDRDGEDAILSYSLDPIVRGRGWGHWIVAEALKRVAVLAVRTLRAEVRPSNIASGRVFSRLGFARSDRDGKWVFEWRFGEGRAEAG